MQRISTLLAICMLVTFVLSCEKRSYNCPPTSQYQQVTPSAKLWFPYSADRNIVFETATGVRDSVELKNRFLGEGEVWLGDACDMSKGEFLRGDIIDKKSGDTLKTEIGYGDQVTIKRNAAYLQYFDTKGVTISPSAYRRFESTLTLNGKVYTSVLAFECSPTDKCTRTGINKFYFSKNVGLVAFERNGTLFTLR